MSDMLDRQTLIRALESESEAMPAAKRREFKAFLNRLDPPQQRLRFGKGPR